MLAFWWTGRGYLALLSLIGVYGVFGAIVTFVAGSDAFERFPWIWGVGAILSALVIWVLGCRLNHRSLAIPLRGARNRLLYRARNRFCSVPLETWAIPMLALAAIQLVRGVVVRA